MSLSGVIGWLVVGSLSIGTLWILDLRRRPVHTVSWLTVVGVAFLVTAALHVVLALRAGFAAVFALAIVTFPFTWLQCFIANLLAKYAWDQRAKSA